MTNPKVEKVEKGEAHHLDVPDAHTLARQHVATRAAQIWRTLLPRARAVVKELACHPVKPVVTAIVNMAVDNHAG